MEILPVYSVLDLSVIILSRKNAFHTSQGFFSRNTYDDIFLLSRFQFSFIFKSQKSVCLVCHTDVYIYNVWHMMALRVNIVKFRFEMKCNLYSVFWKYSKSIILCMYGICNGIVSDVRLELYSQC